MDAAIAELAARQHGVVARRQLVELGLGEYAVRHRIRAGRLHVLHRGVYAVGHLRLSLAGARMGAALACGPGAALSDAAAGACWGLRPSGGALIDVTAPREVRRPRIRVHVRRLPADERTVHDGIPITTVPRTLLDLAATLQPHQLAAAVNQAEVLRLTDPLSLPQLLERYPGRRGTRRVREVMGETTGVPRSELEALFQEFLRKADLPRPETNAAFHLAGRWIEVDCLWREARVALELDGRMVHDTRASFESDRLRDRELVVAGWTPVRVTWRQLERDARRLEADLRVLLTSARRATP
ncbi:MAG: type IV toxin-antitoxin system AbiEi family antitoxin domain-containing protein [Thermoleophilaceae bacterium]|nr:type IV toxin-antitoxin system AbiEi family antitoxin domain-containing protein [Thermoleophilaceae bacterium]